MNKFLIPTILAATILIAGVFALAPMEKASTVHTTITGQIATISAQSTLSLNAAGADVDLVADSATVKRGHLCIAVVDTGADWDNTLKYEINSAGNVLDLLANGTFDGTDSCTDFVAYRVFLPDDTNASDATVTFVVSYTESNS